MTRNQIILCVVSTVTSLLGLEIFAQVKLYQQSQLRPPIYIADPILGFRLKHALEVKPTKTTRILMLGDSFTQGNEVSQTFSQLLAAKLNVQVINAGIRGGSPLQYYLWLKTEGLKFDPDIVVLNFYLGNDITDALMFNTATDSAGLATKLSLKDTYVDDQGYLRRRHTQFSLCELSAFCRLYLRPKPKSTNWDSTAWQITKRHLLAINQLAQGRFILTLIPEASNFDTPLRQLLIDFATDNKIKLIDFTPRLDPSMYDTFDRHWNQSGHNQVANILYEYFLSL